MGLAFTVGIGVFCEGVGAHSRKDLLFEEDGDGGILSRDHEWSARGVAVIKYFGFAFVLSRCMTDLVLCFKSPP